MKTLSLSSLASALAIHCAVVTVLSACVQKAEAPAATAAVAASSANTRSEGEPQDDAATADVQAHDESDAEDNDAANANESTESTDPFAGLGEVTFRPVATTSLRATQDQADLALAAERHNDALRWRKLAEGDAAANAADIAEASSTAPASAEAPAAAASASPAKPAAVIDERKFVEDKNGQWATTARASSSYASSDDPKAGYSAWQTTGAPNVSRYSDDPAAWTTKSGDSTEPAWLEVGFAKPVHATSVRVRQTSGPGVISKLELLDELGIAHEVWAGVDDTPYVDKAIGWFVKDFPPTPYRVKGVRLTLMPARVWGWNEIDAVQLVGAE